MGGLLGYLRDWRGGSLKRQKLVFPKHHPSGEEIVAAFVGWELPRLVHAEARLLIGIPPPLAMTKGES